MTPLRFTDPAKSLLIPRNGVGAFFLALVTLFSTTQAGAGGGEVSTDFANARLLGDDFVVTSLADSGPGTLRQAIADAADASEAGSVITFTKKLNGKTIKLSSGQLEVAENAPPLEISACDLAKGITIDGQQLSRILKINTGTNVRLEGLTLTGGNAADSPGASGDGENGGAILTESGLQMADCVVSGNSAGNGGVTSGNGGAGGGIHANISGGALIALTRCSINENTSGDSPAATSGPSGGGIYFEGAGCFLEITDSVLSENTTGAGANFQGVGGAINFQSGTLTVTSSLFQNNTAHDGGGIQCSLGSQTFLNSTFTGNEAARLGGAVNRASASNQHYIHCTISGNTAGVSRGGIDGGGTIKNSIIAGNSAPAEANISTGFTESGTNLTSGDPMLAPLGDYGGATQTQPPRRGSPALDVEDFDDVTTDQRGERRIPGLKVDAGAVEVDCQLEPRLLIENGANVFTVTSTKDSGAGTLRQAVADANAVFLENSVIVFSSKLNGKTITLTSGRIDVGLVVSSKVAILGASLGKGSTEPIDLSKGVTISGNQNSQVFFATGDVLLRNLTIRDGVDSTSFNGGGGILASNRLTLCDCVITENKTADETVTLVESRSGGGLYVSSGAECVMLRCIVSKNSTGNSLDQVGHGGGIENLGTLICIDSTIEQNFMGETQIGNEGGGGGIRSIGILSMYSSTISNNEVEGVGGGILTRSSGTSFLTNCTITGNSAANFAGGVACEGETVLTHCTVTGNSAGYAGGVSTNTTTLENTIVSDNSGSFEKNVSGAFTDLGNNRVTDGADLAPLGDYGGLTKTMPPLPGSLVINAVVASGVVETDQRGAARNDPSGDDIGAVEMDADLLLYLTRITDAGATNAPGSMAAGQIEENAAGNFSGSVTNSTNNAAEGIVTAKMSSTGAISGSLTVSALGLKRAGFKIQLDSSGDFPEATVTIKGVDYRIAMTLNETTTGDSHYSLNGYIFPSDDPGNILNFVIDRMDFHKKLNPAPFAGKYTSLLPATTDQQAPQGDGYGLATVGTDGKIRFSGALGDGSKFTVGGSVSANTQWQLFKELYRTKPKGRISGTVIFQEDADRASDFSGSLVWIKEADAREKFYPDGFEIPVQEIIGSKYVAPFPNEAILSGIVTTEPDNATWEIGKGNTAPAMQYVTWSGKNKISASHLATGQSLKIGPSTKSGLVKGSYVDKSTGQKTSFAGVAFQKQNVVAGLFPGDEKETGFFAIRPSGAGVLQIVETRFGIIVTPSSGFPMGDVGVDRGFDDRQFRATNLGDGTLRILGFESSHSDFTVINDQPRVLKPGESVVFWIRFDPSSTGHKVTEVTVSSDGGDVIIRTNAIGLAGNANGNAGRIYHGTEWTGASPDDRPSHLMSTATNSYTPSVNGGTYQGFTYSGPGESVTGFVTVKADTKNANFSGSAVINGVKETFKGAVDSGSFTGVTNRGQSVSFSVHQVNSGGGFKLVGQFSGVNEDHHFELVRNGFHKTTNPNTQFVGPFTMLMPSVNHRGDATPLGDGYGSASFGADGRSRAILVLGDGTKITHSGFVSLDGEWIIHRSLYRTKPNGHFAGRLQFRDEVGISDFDGELEWLKHPDRREKRFNRGFKVRQVTLGSAYTPSAKGERAFDHLDTSGGLALLKFTEGDVLNLAEQHFLDWDTNNKVTLVMPESGEKVSARVNHKTGIVTGSYSHKSRKLKVSFGGAIFEKQNILTGLFISSENTGVMDMIPED